jgi:hypothetical protein
MYNTIGNTPPESVELYLGTRSPSSAIKNEWHSRGYLPHLDRIGLLQSITFRLADSLPQEKLRELEKEMKKMKKKKEDEEGTNAELGLRAPRVHASKGFAPRVWMPDYWDRYIRDEKHLHSLIDYIHNNPVKAGLCQKETDWLWSSAYFVN